MGEVVKFRPRRQLDEDGVEMVPPSMLDMAGRWVFVAVTVAWAGFVVWSIPKMTLAGVHLVMGWVGLE